jgi:hypothetical protein
VPCKEPSASDSEGLPRGDSPMRLLVGLVGRGEKVPWLQGPSWASSRRSNAVPSNAVDSVGRGLLGPARCGCAAAGSVLLGDAGSGGSSTELEDDAV